jgi:hypothetical protein
MTPPQMLGLRGGGIPVSVHDAFNRLIASETSEYLPFVLETVIGLRATSGQRHQLAAKWTGWPIAHAKTLRFLS